MQESALKISTKCQPLCSGCNELIPQIYFTLEVLVMMISLLGSHVYKNFCQMSMQIVFLNMWP